MKVVRSLTPGLENEFCELRANALSWCLQDVGERLMDQKQIVPTEDENHIGTIWELIEGQVREAVRELNNKGYCTTDSGFSGTPSIHQKQFLEGLFSLDLDTVKVLQDSDIYVENDKWRTKIWFYPENPDFEEIKNTWNEITATIPDLGHKAKSQDEIMAPRLKRIWAEMERKEKAKTIKIL